MQLDSSIESARTMSQQAAQASRSQVELFLKRVLDLLGATMLLILLSPVFLLAALLIVADDGLPVFYRRRIIAKNGEFDAFKFRSMRRDADEILNRDSVLRAEFEESYKLKRDPRLTKVGAFLRRHSLDELPQLFNVVLGEMSLVGPRMITAPELAKYGPFQELFLSVKPGITGYWQVNGRQEVSYEERVAMDVHYINNWSLWLDLKILILTPLKVIKREGAY